MLEFFKRMLILLLIVLLVPNVGQAAVSIDDKNDPTNDKFLREKNLEIIQLSPEEFIKSYNYVTPRRLYTKTSNLRSLQSNFRIVKSNNANKREVYLSDGKFKHLLYGMDALAELGYDLSDIVSVEDIELKRLQLGKTLAVEHLTDELKAKYSKPKTPVTATTTTATTAATTATTATATNDNDNDTHAPQHSASQHANTADTSDVSQSNYRVIKSNDMHKREVYLTDGKVKHLIYGMGTLLELGYTLSDVASVDDSELGRLQTSKTLDVDHLSAVMKAKYSKSKTPAPVTGTTTATAATNGNDDDTHVPQHSSSQHTNAADTTDASPTNYRVIKSNNIRKREVYLTDGKVKHLIYGMDTLTALGYSLSDIVGVDDSELGRLQTSKTLAMEHLSVAMKAKYSKPKTPVTTATTAATTSKDNDDETHNAQISKTGDESPTNYRVVKSSNIRKRDVYLTDGKVKHLIYGMDTLTTLGYALSDIISVDDSELGRLQTSKTLAMEHLSAAMKAKYSKPKPTFAPANDDDIPNTAQSSSQHSNTVSTTSLSPSKFRIVKSNDKVKHEVYLIDSKFKHLVHGMGALTELGYALSDIVSVEDTELERLQDGKTLSFEHLTDEIKATYSKSKSV